MKLIDLLNDVIEEWDGELVCEFESQHSFCWSKGQEEFTEEGKKKFEKILQSEVKLNRGVLELKDKTITEEEYHLFMEACAGYIPLSDYKKWFKGEDGRK